MHSKFVLLREFNGTEPKFGVLSWTGHVPCYDFEYPDSIRAEDLPKYGDARRFTGLEIARILGEHTK